MKQHALYDYLEQQYNYFQKYCAERLDKTHPDNPLQLRIVDSRARDNHACKVLVRTVGKVLFFGDILHRGGVEENTYDTPNLNLNDLVYLSLL